jgi:hypothetical protein
VTVSAVVQSAAAAAAGMHCGIAKSMPFWPCPVADSVHCRVATGVQSAAAAGAAAAVVAAAVVGDTTRSSLGAIDSAMTLG